MKPPLFSVVIPTFNRSDIFPAAVRSILAQTCGDFEVIVSDNYSTDDTPQVAAQFTDPRVKYVRTPRHVVIADSWEFARQQASGRLIIMLSDDDALVSTNSRNLRRGSGTPRRRFRVQRRGSLPRPQLPRTGTEYDRVPGVLRDVASGVGRGICPAVVSLPPVVRHASERLCVFEGSCRPHSPSDRPLLLDQWRRIFCVADDGGLRENDRIRRCAR